MEGGLSGIHQMLGGLVVVAFMVTAVLAAIQVSGRGGEAVRVVSYAAAGLLLLQFVLGLLLLGGGERNTTIHYVVALLAVIPVVLQHGAGRRLSPRSRSVATLIWALAAAFLTILAYLTGQQGVG